MGPTTWKPRRTGRQKARIDCPAVRSFWSGNRYHLFTADLMRRAAPVDPRIAEAVEDPDTVGMDQRFVAHGLEREEGPFGVIPAVPASSEERREFRALDDKSPRGQQDRSSQPGLNARLGTSVVDLDHRGILTLAVGCP